MKQKEFISGGREGTVRSDGKDGDEQMNDVASLSNQSLSRQGSQSSGGERGPERETD